MSDKSVFTPEQAVDDIRRLSKKIERHSSRHMEAMKGIQSECQEKIQQLKYELSNELIDKANAPINRAVSILNWVLAAVVVVGGALAWLTANNLKTTLQTLMTQRIESWLSLDDEHSQASKTLDDYRTRALLDAYMIQLARQKSQNTSIVALNFKISDKKRLMSIVRSPSSNHQDFYDALRLLAVADGEWGIIVGESELGRDLVELIEDPRFDSTRKLEILEVLSRNRNLAGVEMAYLQDASAPEPLRYQSYLNLKGYDKGSAPAELALKYAIGLLQNGSNHKVERALEHIAAADPFNAELTELLKKLPERQREQRMSYRLAIAKGLINQLPSADAINFFEIEDTEPVDRGAVRAKVATLFSDLLEDGLKLGMDRTFTEQRHLTLHYTQATGLTVYETFPLERLLGDEQLMQAIYERQYPKGLGHFAQFFSVTDGGEVIALAKLKVPATALGVEHDPSLPRDIIGRLELSQDRKPQIAWRDSMGDLNYNGVETLSKAKVIMVFDKDSISYRDTSLTNWIF